MKKVFFSVLFLSVTIGQGAYPMAAGFNRAATWITRSLFFAPFVATTIAATYYNLNSKELDKVHSSTDSFVRNSLAEAGYPSQMIDGLQIKEIKEGYYTIGNTLLVPRDLESAIFKKAMGAFQPITIDEKKYLKDYEDLSEKVREDTEEYTKALSLAYGLKEEIIRKVLGGVGTINNKYTLSLAKFFIPHEGGHVYHNHNQKFLAASFGIPMTIQLITSGSAYMINKVIHSPLHFTRAFAKIGGLPLKLIGAFGINCLYKRSCEEQADKEAIKRIKDPKVLKVSAEVFEAIDEFQQVLAKKIFGPGIHPNIATTIFDPVHPRAQKRAERLRKAAKELEKKQQK